MTHKKGPQLPYKKRDDLTGEHVFGDTGQILLLILFLGIWISDSFIFRYSLFLTQKLPVAVRLGAALCLWIPAGLLAGAGLKIVFGEVRDPPIVIKKGVFRLVRHPVYLGAILLILGLLVYSLSLSASGVWIVIILFYIHISRHEEKLLLRKFGKAYEDYQKEVPMLIPRLRRR